MINKNLLKYNYLIQTKKKLNFKNFILNIEFLIFKKKYKKILQLKIEKIRKIKKHNNNIKNKQYIKNLFIKKKLLKQIKIKKKFLENCKINLTQYLSIIPNLPDKSILKKKNLNNQIIKIWGKIRKKKYQIYNHIKIGEKLNGLDFKTSIKLSGSRFVIMKNKIAQLHRALIQFMVDLHTEKHGYIEVYVPYLVNKNSLYCTGQLPKFSKNLLHVKFYNKFNKNNKYILIPTGEVPLTNLFNNKILEEKNLPIKLITHTPCFRAENSSYSKKNKGLIRMHQFDKVEIVQITSSKNSIKILENITKHAETILKLLNLPYRKILLCAKNLGFSSSKTYDLEVWMPSQKKYYEISSCSNMTDFQSKRMNTKYKYKNKKLYVHTLNGSGLAISRTLAAILENYQTKEGKIEIPKVLYSYMNGLKYIY
ncbi:serine--tRNA ligase [Enterobacteriaceae bacterium ET-AT1-13]|nr:serine--tRNA ligase [Enterobacteriaceae bacterium ET-AT1-13]WMC17717.1 MAG: serine--tRNA ligase [Enterobacteriaceae bacterium PSmelAO3-2]WMC17921.1 MAG: serine--tRNA ligase [Enterobacteriaceae bacterium PSmelAO3-1]WMC18124.1 MAG: serine--tRNA ligase [Enterobacteriaceae bacterium PSmelAO1]